MNDMPWPFPGDNKADRVRRLLHGYREGLLSSSPDLCRELDAQVVKLGHGWVLPQSSSVVDDDWLPVREAAQLARRTPQAVHNWIKRDGLPSRTANGRVLVQVGPTMEMARQQRLRRAEHAA